MNASDPRIHAIHRLVGELLAEAEDEGTIDKATAQAGYSICMALTQGLTIQAAPRSALEAMVIWARETRGETAPTVETLEKVARALGVLPFELLRFEGEPSPADDMCRLVTAYVQRADRKDVERLRKVIAAFCSGGAQASLASPVTRN